MKLSVIIPCHPRNKPSLARTLKSLECAAAGFQVEYLVLEDAESRGPSWARNQALERATGDYVFFADADDEVRPEFFSAPVRRFEATNADLVFSQTAVWPLTELWELEGNAAVRQALLPAFCGYSFEDVRRWNAGGRLNARRQGGYIFRCAFRREFLERHRLRFDERLRFSEDAAFLAECALYAERVASTPAVTYDYRPSADGAGSVYRRGEPYWQYKFAALANRLTLAARAPQGETALASFAASAVFSALEFLKARRWRDLRRYVGVTWVARSIREFPRSWRHPLTALAVTALRLGLPRRPAAGEDLVKLTAADCPHLAAAARRLSVVIPTKNEEANIAACIRAFDGWRGEEGVEIVVVDNASTDRTAALAAELGVKVLTAGPERCAQRNCGWRNSRGEQVLFLDADMILPAATLRELLAKLATAGGETCFYIPERRVGRGLRMAARNFERTFYNGTSIDGLRLVPRALLERTGGYDEQLVACEDWDLDRRLLAAGATTAILEGELLHNEARQGLGRFLKKKAYYSTSVAAYRRKWGEDEICRRQFGFGYRYWGVFMERGKWRQVVAHPLLFLVMMAERVAVGIVYLACR